jgi:hypothetical protein
MTRKNAEKGWNQMKLSIVKILLISATIGAWSVGCGEKDNPTGPSGTRATNYNVSYVQNGNTLTLTVSQYTYSFTYCNGDSLVSQTDTMPDTSYSMRIELSANTLKMFPGLKDTLDSSKAVVELYMALSRKSSGTGLTGVWTLNGYNYEVISGMPTQGELSKNIFINFMDFYEGMTFEYEFTGSQINYYVSGEYDHAKNFIDNWNGKYYVGIDADSSRYAISIQKTGKTVVQLTGLKSGEIVTVVFSQISFNDLINNNVGTTTYSSTNPSHPQYVYDSNKKTCPNAPEPSWYWEFLDSNSKIPGATGISKSGSESFRKFYNPVVRFHYFDLPIFLLFHFRQLPGPRLGID